MKLSIGTIAHFAGNFVPLDWLLCDGRRLEHYTGKNSILWSALEHRPEIKRDKCYFWLPNFPVKSGVPRQFIMESGRFPPSFDDSRDFYGLITTIEADEAVPDNWALCDGRELPIKGNEKLFTIINDSYSIFGTTGTDNFALPKMANLGTKRYIICVNGSYPQHLR